jgi:lipopolysaccharide assembly protein A
MVGFETLKLCWLLFKRPNRSVDHLKTRSAAFSPTKIQRAHPRRQLRQDKPPASAIHHFLPSREGFYYNTGHFGAGNTLARRVIHQASVTTQLPSRDLFMKFIVWLIRVLVFVLLLVLALSNTQPATLNFLAGYAWSAPLILIGLAFFVVGLLAGLVSAMPAVVRLRMENGRLKRELRVARETPAVVEQPPLPPLI